MTDIIVNDSDGHDILDEKTDASQESEGNFNIDDNINEFNLDCNIVYKPHESTSRDENINMLIIQEEVLSFLLFFLKNIFIATQNYHFPLYVVPFCTDRTIEPVFKNFRSMD